ncbi:DNA-binding transcriptional regulator, MerR family [Lentibacillus halodurans]|uniref:DNA-binding transcriptional regulator, MerR family n=1 Tax=Lentibacillus halodurans TaxID=237679 RepID=A0A1I0ZUA0_9BACI|nr:MerR family transcriptional regulator [Lentibacillus halodurans]SFB29275.1 DNA-binding transcriptional regulator, MerR family [Lentibacillus halodurans]
MKYTVKQVTEIVGVSNTTLKRYEKSGLIPPVFYTKGHQRRYEEIHLTAFKTIRKLLQGFGTPIAYKLMRLAKELKFTKAHWIIAQEQKKLVEEREQLKQHKELLLALPNQSIKINRMRIGELAKFVNVETSTIRYWEERNLIRGIRDDSNGYRYFEEHEVKKTIIISLLRKTVYYIDKIKEIIEGTHDEDLSNIRKHYSLTEKKNDMYLAKQLNAISLYMRYCTDLMEIKNDN